MHKLMEMFTKLVMSNKRFKASIASAIAIALVGYFTTLGIDLPKEQVVQFIEHLVDQITIVITAFIIGDTIRGSAGAKDLIELFTKGFKPKSQ